MWAVIATVYVYHHSYGSLICVTDSHSHLVIIANSLTEKCGHKTFQVSGFWADYGQSGSNPQLAITGLLINKAN